MKKRTQFLGALCAAFGAFSVQAAEPWALWDCFTGADAENGLAPNLSSLQGGVDGGTWRLKLAGNASVNADGSLQTGTTAPARIDFGGTLDLGYSANTFTVLITVKNAAATTDRPIWHAGNGSNGVGTAIAAINLSAGTATLRGSWANAAWGTPRITANEVAARDAEFTFAGFATTPLTLSQISNGVISTLGSFSGLQGSAISATGIYFGNFVNATSGGLNCTITRVAVYRGELSNADLMVCMANYYSTTVGAADAWEDLSWKRTANADPVPSSALPADAGLILTTAAGATPVVAFAAHPKAPVFASGGLTLEITSGCLTLPRSLSFGGLTLRSGAMLSIPAGELLELTTAPSFEAGASIDLSPWFVANEGTCPIITWSEGSIDSEALAALNATFSGACSVRQNGSTLEVVVDRSKGKVTILSIGDSITEGESGTISYRRRLWEKLAEQGYNVETTGIRNGIKGTVQNAPWAWHAAWYSARLSQRSSGQTSIRMVIDNTLEAAGYPDVITLLIGVNDLSMAGVTQEAVFESWCEFVGHITALRPQSKILVATLLPTRSDNACYTKTEPYNEQIRALFADGAQPFGPNVSLVDLGASVSFVNSDFADSIHPGATGCEKVAAAWLPAVMAAVEPTGLAGAPVPVQAFNEGDSTVKVRFNKPLLAASLENSSATLGETALDAPAWIDERTLAYTLSAPLAAQQKCTLTVTGLTGLESGAQASSQSITFTALGSGAADNIPEALIGGYVPLKSLDIEANARYAESVPYSYEADGLDIARIGRVGYYLELQRPGQPAQFVWVSMNNFAASLEQLGVPLPARGTVQKYVTGLEIFANRGATSTADGETVEGFIEFTPFNYGAAASGVAGAPAEAVTGALDWNDAMGTTGSYSCMQIHRKLPAGSYQSAEVLFAFNRFRFENDTLPVELGIGSFGSHLNNAGGGNSYAIDWTFVSASGLEKMLATAYTIRRLEIWVKPFDELTWVGETQGSGNWHAQGAWLAGDQPQTYTEGNKVIFGDIAGAAEASVAINEPAAPFAVTFDAPATAYTLSGTGALTTTAFTQSTGTLTLNLPATLGGGSLGSGATLNLGVSGSTLNLSGDDATIRTTGNASVTVGAAYNGNLTIDEGTTLTLLGQRGDVGAVGYSKTLSGSGTLICKARTDFTAQHPDFNGTIQGEGSLFIFKDTAGNAFTDANRPAIDLGRSCTLTIGAGYRAEGCALRLRRLTGTAAVSTTWDTPTGSRTIDLKLDADSTFGGQFQQGGNRHPALIVRGDTARRVLTLTAASTSLGTLTVGELAEVILPEGASWAGAITIASGGILSGGATLTRADAETYPILIGAGGRLNPGPTFTGAPLLLAPGAILTANGTPIATTGGVALSGSGTVTIEMSSTSAPGIGQHWVVLTNAGTLTAADFTLTGAKARTHCLAVQDGELRLIRAPGTLISIF